MDEIRIAILLAISSKNEEDIKKLKRKIKKVELNSMKSRQALSILE